MDAATNARGIRDMLLNVNLQGRLKKIRASLPSSIQAVFEAVSNSFDATDHLGPQGRITVHILKRDETPAFTQSEGPNWVLYGYKIEDNGEGFNNKNMGHFKETDTTNKVWGKGVGRFLWLKVFDKAEVVSVYEEGGEWRERSFTFSIKAIGVDDSDTVPRKLPESAKSNTKVSLISPKQDRIPHLPGKPNDLAGKLLEHFLLHFTVLKGQMLYVVDDTNGDSVSVNQLYQDIIEGRHIVDELDIRGSKFLLHHLFIKPTNARRNLVKLCAKRRVVASESLTSIIPEIEPTRAVTMDGYRYHAYVTGEYLDGIVNEERSELRFPKNTETDEEFKVDTETPPSLLMDGEDSSQTDNVNKEELFNCLAEKIRIYLSDDIADVRKKREKLIEDFAAQDQPQFRPFVESAKKRLDRLKAKPTKRDIEIALCEAKIDGRDELYKLVEEIVAKKPSIGKVKEVRKQLFDKFVTAANSHNQSALAEFVCTRKAVIQVLQASLKKNNEGEYEYEEAIHDLIFPKKFTSNELPVGPNDDRKMHIENLWLIDEKLVFHRVLASDIPINGLTSFHGGESTALDKSPDITVFDPAFTTAGGDGLQSIAIVEFKRPGRTVYTETDNPIRQLIDAATQIRNGSIETIDGELVPVHDGVVIFGYGVCDLTDKINSLARTYDMQKTVDGSGYYRFHSGLNMVMELIPYHKLADSSARRNEAFFKILGLP